VDVAGVLSANVTLAVIFVPCTNADGFAHTATEQLARQTVLSITGAGDVCPSSFASWYEFVNATLVSVSVGTVVTLGFAPPAGLACFPLPADWNPCPYTPPVTVTSTSSPGSLPGGVTVPVIVPSDHPVTTNCSGPVVSPTTETPAGEATDPKPTPAIVTVVVEPAGQLDGVIALIYGNPGTTTAPTGTVELPAESTTVPELAPADALPIGPYVKFTCENPTAPSVNPIPCNPEIDTPVTPDKQLPVTSADPDAPATNAFVATPSTVIPVTTGAHAGCTQLSDCENALKSSKR
jgi:hypothetical protein